ncbi:MAG TPA: RNA-binding protein [Pseudorhodoplanes sp.]|nr:RNA-binding protein [Pseudorhodoplanes sp.]
MLARQDDNVIDRGPTGAAAERCCALSREVKPVGELIRFVIGPDGGIVPDVKHKLPGRGVWLTASRDALGRAVKANVFAKSFRKDVRAPDDLVAQTERLLERAALDALAIAGKARQAVCGFARVEAALAGGEAVALLHASDGAADGIRKLNGLLRRRGEQNAGEIAIIDTFSSAQLDLAFGRPNVIHAALLAGDASKGFLARYRRYERFRTGIAGNPGQAERGIGMLND